MPEITREQRFENQRVWLSAVAARTEFDLANSAFRGTPGEFHVLVEVEIARRVVAALTKTPELNYSFEDAKAGSEFCEPSAADLEKVLPDENGHA